MTTTRLTRAPCTTTKLRTFTTICATAGAPGRSCVTTKTSEMVSVKAGGGVLFVCAGACGCAGACASAYACTSTCIYM